MLKLFIAVVCLILTGRTFAMDNSALVIKKKEAQFSAESPFCGALSIVSTFKDNPKMDVARFTDIRKTKAHFHKNFEEIYMVVDGWLDLEFYEPQTGKRTSERLEADEMAMIGAGIHHRILDSSEKNRLYVFCLPGFNPEDETPSDILND